jgi:Biotin-requiring enzyme
MIKLLLKIIFNSKTKNSELLKELSKNPSFKTVEEIENNPNLRNNSKIIKLEKGEIKSITLPNFENIKGLYISEWKKKNGEIINSGDVVCVLVNDNILMELESFYSGKLIITSKLKQQVSMNSELFKVEGV